MDPLSLVAEHCADSGHPFAFQNAEILGRGSDRAARETIEAWLQPIRTQLNEQKSQREHGPNVHPRRTRMQSQHNPDPKNEQLSPRPTQPFIRQVRKYEVRSQPRLTAWDGSFGR
ncbi:unnamed protein product [Schistocephalus solidus]|uniref:Uncharacterized protein n=1 Tax=Schistocephalus solidus TaxID=70667 RepID=A0A183SBE6_SCHSO|nr:unnamed protein product [Schistocephalus solidus]